MDSFIDTLKNMGGARLGALALVFVGLIIFFVFIASRAGDPTMTMLYGDLSSVDSANVAAELEKANIAYSISPDGSQVSVSRPQVGRARMLLAEQGLPNGGSLGYEIFDKAPAFGTTDFVQNINQLRALEGELARTISTLSSIRMARVHLVLPERQLFSRDSRQASASVFIDLQTSAAIDGNQVSAIQHLVASAVPQLKPGNVSVVDESGNLLARGTGEEDAFGLSGTNTEEMRTNYEMRLTRGIEDMVGRIVGFGKVRAHVTVDLDFDRISTNAEIYDPSGQVVRSTQTIEESEEEPVGGDGAVSVANNLPGLPAENGTGGQTASSSRLEEVTNFEISRRVENIVRESGEVNKISVAVLVDGRYRTEITEGAEGEDPLEEQVYEPRNEGELEQIATLVKSAIGYDADRGDTVEVINMQFADVSFGNDTAMDLIFGFQKSDILQIAQTATMGILGVLVLLLVVRPMVGQLVAVAGQASQQAQMEPEMLAASASAPALAPPESGEDTPPPESEFDQMINMSQVEGRVKASSVQKIGELVENHPNETVAVIRNWMSQEG